MIGLGLSRHTTVLSAVLLCLVAINAVWLCLDHSAPAWDDAYYLTNSLRTYDALTDNGLLGFGRQFLRGMSTKPPLIAALPTPIYLILGRHPRAALLVNLAFLLVTLTTTYLLTRALADRAAGLVALCIVGTMPMIYGLSRIFLVECGLTALVMLALYILACADTEALWAPCILGAICGLGLLMKTSFPAYVAAPMVWIVIRGGRATMSRRRIGAFLVPLLLIAGPWYAVNASAALRTALAAGSKETARVYQTGGLAETGQYLVNLMNCGPRLYFVALPLLAILCVSRMSAACRRGILFCFVAALPIAFLAVSHYRDLRYAAPIFPVIAVAVGILATAAISRFPAAAIVVILCIGRRDSRYARRQLRLHEQEVPRRRPVAVRSALQLCSPAATDSFAIPRSAHRDAKAGEMDSRRSAPASPRVRYGYGKCGHCHPDRAGCPHSSRSHHYRVCVSGRAPTVIGVCIILRLCGQCCGFSIQFLSGVPQ